MNKRELTSRYRGRVDKSFNGAVEALSRRTREPGPCEFVEMAQFLEDECRQKKELSGLMKTTLESVLFLHSTMRGFFGVLDFEGKASLFSLVDMIDAVECSFDDGSLDMVRTNAVHHLGPVSYCHVVRDMIWNETTAGEYKSDHAPDLSRVTSFDVSSIESWETLNKVVDRILDEGNYDKGRRVFNREAFDFLYGKVTAREKLGGIPVRIFF